jgi:hypothetical protein
MLIFLGELVKLGVVSMMYGFRNWRKGGVMMSIVDDKAARARSSILVFFQIHKTRHGFCSLCTVFTSDLRLGTLTCTVCEEQDPRI